jgi:hypothetical protein
MRNETTSLRGILVAETELARQFKVADRLVWIPRSVVHAITKFAPDTNGHRECLLDIEQWFADKEGL